MLNIGVIGCGRWFELHHVPALQKLGDRRIAKVVALADFSESRLAVIGKSLNVAPDRCYCNYKDLLRAEKGKIDFLDLALPHHLHKPAIVDAARAGYAILTEKPLCINLKEARSILKVIEEKKAYFGIIHNYQFSPEAQALVAAVGKGKIGKGFLYRVEHLLDAYWPGVSEYQSDWRSRSDKGGGGCLLDNGYHYIYMAEKYMQSPIVKVFAQVARYSRAEYSVEDTAIALLFHQNGATTSLQVAWSISSGAVDVEEIYGTKGTISLNHPDLGPLSLYLNETAKWKPLKTRPPVRRSYETLLEKFITALIAGEPYQDSIVAAWNNMAVIEAAYKSAALRREITVERWSN